MSLIKHNPKNIKGQIKNGVIFILIAIPLFIIFFLLCLLSRYDKEIRYNTTKNVEQQKIIETNKTDLNETSLPNDLFSEKFDWQKPEIIPKLGLVSDQLAECGFQPFDEGCDKDRLKKEVSNLEYYKIANFTYQNKPGTVILFYFFFWDPEEYYFVNWDNKIIMLAKESADIRENVFNPKIVNINYNLELPKDNTLDVLELSGKQILSKSPHIAMADFLDQQSGFFPNEFKRDDRELKILSNFNGHDIWNDKDMFVVFANNIYGLRPEHYSIEIPAEYKQLNGQQTALTSKYDPTIYECCGDQPRNLLDYETININESDMKLVGRADDNNEIFEIVNKENTTLDYYFVTYNSLKPNDQPQVSIDDFIKLKPLLVYKSNFGFYVLLKNRELIFTP